jgi:hypothetical protein
VGDAGQVVMVTFIQVSVGALAFVACWNFFRAMSR